jgi:hypothetical protein
MDLKRMKELSGIIEGKPDYEESIEFTEDYTRIDGWVEDIEDIIDTRAWDNYMRVTEQNFGGNIKHLSDEMKHDFKAFVKSWKLFVVTLEKTTE